MELSDTEKQKIRLEEIFRQEVKEELDAKKKMKASKKLSIFLNSSLGIFLLSTIFVSLFSWIYSQYSEGRKQSQEKLNSIEKLRLEIQYRVNTIDNANETLLERQFSLLMSAYNGNSSDYGYGKSSKVIFPEYQNRSLFSLIYEYDKIAGNSDKQPIAPSFKKASFYLDKLQTSPKDTSLQVSDNTTEITHYYRMTRNDSIQYSKAVNEMNEVISSWK